MTFDYRSVMSGRRRDPLAILMRGGLWLASCGYATVMAIRNRKYDSGKSEIHRCGVPVISVGNLTTGGTGKTPIVCFLARRLRERGIQVAIVSRGYGRGDADENDEALELHSRLPDVPHVQDADRVAAATIAVEELESEVILMDDGFQHRRLHRDINIVVVDATCPFGFGHVLPRGLLREPVKSIERADLVIVSRCGAVDDDALREIEAQIRRYHSHVPIVHSDHRPTTLLEFPDQQQAVEQLAGKNVAVVCAIGNPDAFIETVRACGANVAASKCLSDHDSYSPTTMQELQTWLRGLDDSIDQVVCTHKDLVKIRSDRIGGKPLAAILIELTLLSDANPIDELISNALAEST